MKRMGMVIGVKPERIVEYKKTHAAVWAEVLAKISDCNIRNYTIFLREPENLLFGYFEYHGADWAADAAEMEADPKTQEWWAIHKPMQAPLAQAERKAIGGRWRRRCFTTTEVSSSSHGFRPHHASPVLASAIASKPIVTIGAGSIVVDAHFPAYRKAGFPIAGVYDLDVSRAKSVADKFGVAKIFSSLDEAVATEGAIFDLATPPGALKSVLERIPVGSGVLIQKPMGADVDQATEILKVCRDRKLAAAVNFQLRFAPMMLAVRDALDRGLLGRLVDVEVHLAIDTPWSLFAFLKGLPRIEIAVHSIHYLDLIRGFLGDPGGVHAKTIGHPSSDIAQTRTTAILDYGNEVRSAMSINHNHAFGRKHQVAEFRFDGTEGRGARQARPPR